MSRYRAAALVLVITSAGCDDEKFQPCGPYKADYRGVECFIQTQCVSCHGERHVDPGVSTVLPLDLARDLESCSGELVKPGDLEGSKLWRVVSGNIWTSENVPSGQSIDWGVMPWFQGADNEEPLPKEEWQHIEQWILDGAPYGVNPVSGSLVYPDCGGT